MHINKALLPKREMDARLERDVRHRFITLSGRRRLTGAQTVVRRLTRSRSLEHPLHRVARSDRRRKVSRRERGYRSGSVARRRAPERDGRTRADRPPGSMVIGKAGRGVADSETGRSARVGPAAEAETVQESRPFAFVLLL